MSTTERLNKIRSLTMLDLYKCVETIKDTENREAGIIYLPFNWHDEEECSEFSVAAARMKNKWKELMTSKLNDSDIEKLDPEVAELFRYMLEELT